MDTRWREKERETSGMIWSYAEDVLKQDGSEDKETEEDRVIKVVEVGLVASYSASFF